MKKCASWYNNATMQARYAQRRTLSFQNPPSGETHSEGASFHSHEYGFRRSGPAIREGGIPVIRKGCFVFFTLLWGLWCVAPLPALAGVHAVDDVEYSTPHGWVQQESPGAKAYHVLMYQGHPVGELFLMKESLFEQKSPATVLQEGIRKNAAGFAGYQAIGMRNISLSGTEAVMHDFLYCPPGSPVQFAGRVVVLVVDKSAYTFFFNTTINTAAMLEGPFSEVVSSVRVIRKPVAPPRKVQEGVFSIELAPGWREANDLKEEGVHCYDYYGDTGEDTVLISLLAFGRSTGDESTALSAIVEKKNPLEAVLNAMIDMHKRRGKYTPLQTKTRSVAGCDAIVHDFSIQKPDSNFVYRLCVVAVKQQENTPSRVFAPAVYDFTFPSFEMDRFNKGKAAVDALLDSMTLIQPLPALSPPPPFADLQDERIFRSPTEHFTLTLPEGAKQDAMEQLDPVDVLGESFTYTIEGKKDTIILLSTFYSALDGEFAHEELLDELEAKESGQATWEIQGRNVPVGLYSARGGKALVTALFADDDLLLAVLLPKKEYGAAQGWIKELINGVRFEK